MQLFWHCRGCVIDSYRYIMYVSVESFILCSLSAGCLINLFLPHPLNVWCRYSDQPPLRSVFDLFILMNRSGIFNVGTMSGEQDSVYERTHRSGIFKRYNVVNVRWI